jgi:hypothetical protein
MTSVADKSSTAARAVRNGSSLLVRLGRLGYVAKGIVYIVIGILATEAALGVGGRSTDSRGALQAIGDKPFGKIALVIVMIGLFGYAAWRLTSAITDAERRGDAPSSIAMRIADAGRGLAYGWLGVWTLRYLTSDGSRRGNQARGWTDRVLDLPAGRWMVIAIGLGIIGYAGYQLYRAATGGFLKRLDFGSSSATAKRWVERSGRFGIAARAVVFGIIGVLVARAGWTYDPSKAGGIRESLNVLAVQPLGRVLFGVVAIGLIAFGLFELATARYRVMRAA